MPEHRARFVDLNGWTPGPIKLAVVAALEPMQENLSRIVESGTLDVDTGRLFPSLPNLSELRQSHERMAWSTAAFDESGSRLEAPLWVRRQDRGPLGIERVIPRVRGAAGVNRLLGLARRDEFSIRLANYFSSCTVLQRRWDIIQQALDAHLGRQYALSVPVLLAQVEGIFTDALIAREMVIRHRGKLCVKGPDGEVKLNRNGEPVEVHGLGQKVQNSRFREDEILHDLVGFFADYLVAERNDILHGSSIDYARAKLSVQLMLNVYVLAAEFAEFESGE